MAMRLRSPAFDDGHAIPKKYTEDGENISPPLSWSQPPGGVAEYALIVDDPDAPTEHPWVHWVVLGSPGNADGLPERVPREPTLREPPGARQGMNSWRHNSVGYRGPAPPPGHGTHHYCFKLYALDQPLNLAGGVEKGAVLKAMEGHVLATAELIGTYER
jgi:Raf kinase inhibitor-like YbhB/YbcL family protein